MVFLKTNIVLLAAALGVIFAPAYLFAAISIEGSSTILPVVKEAAKIFTSQTGIQFTIKGGGSSAGLKGAQSGSIDIGMVSRALNSLEAKKLTATTIGNDGISVVMNVAIKVDQLSRKEIVSIFSGQVRNWFGSGHQSFTAYRYPCYFRECAKGYFSTPAPPQLDIPIR